MSSYKPPKAAAKKTRHEQKVRQFIALARVSSRAQEAEGYSLDAQAEALHAYAAKEGGVIVKLWKIAETASKSDRRVSFKELLSYAKSNSNSVDGLLVYKVDRAARNMADYGRLLDLEVTHGVPLIAIGQPTPDTPAGRMARNMMAAMGTFFAEQLASDVKDGLARRVRDGWFPTVAPYGYESRRVEGRSSVFVDRREAENVKHIFDLYAFHHCTIDMIVAKMQEEGRNYTPKQPKWFRSKIHRVLRDRAYIGDIKWHDEWQVGRHEKIVDRIIFDRVQALLGDKIYKAHELLYAGELITCEYCGRPVTGEIVKKKSGKTYTYYRCARYTAVGHPRVRLREEQIDSQILALFESLRQPLAVQEWFRTTLIASTSYQHEKARARCAELQSQLDDVRRQQERLLNLHLCGNIDERTFAAKNTDFRDRLASLTLVLESTDRRTAEKADIALRVFELSQSLPEKWVKSEYEEKRRIVQMVCLNLVLRGTSLCIATRKPFNALVEGLKMTESGEGGIRTPETLARLQHFQCCSFSRSDTSPGGGRHSSLAAASTAFDSHLASPSRSVRVSLNRPVGWLGEGRRS